MSDRQQGNVFNDGSQGNFYGPVTQYFGPPPSPPIADGPPNSLRVYGLPRDRVVGREDDLARLHGRLQEEPRIARGHPDWGKVPSQRPTVGNMRRPMAAVSVGLMG